MNHDWTKLDNGWKRHANDLYLYKDFGGLYTVLVYDSGDVSVTEFVGPDDTLAALIEATAQRKRCEIHKQTAIERAGSHLWDRIDRDRWRIKRGDLQLTLEPIVLSYITWIRVTPDGLSVYLNQSELSELFINDFCATLKVCLAARRILTGDK